MKPKVILFAGAPDRSVITCVRSLDRANIPFIIIPPNQGSTINWEKTPYLDSLVDSYYPPIDKSEEFVEFLTKIGQDGEKRILYLTSERMTRQLSKHKDTLEKNNVIFPAPNIQKYKTIADKSSFYTIGEKHDFNLPQKFEDLPESYDKSFVAKPKKNVSEKGHSLSVYLIDSQRQLKRFQNRESKKEYFFQEYLDGPSYYYCGLYNHGKPIASIGQKTVLQQPDGRSVIKAHPVKLPNKIRQKTEQMLQGVDWHGAIMIEFIKSNDQWYLIEANPRFWGPLQLCVDNDVDLPKLLYEIEATNTIPEKTEPKYKFGYLRKNAHYKGYWIKLATGGSFKRSPEDNLGQYQYLDVWNRNDTKPIYRRKLLEQIFKPVQKVYRRIV